MKKLMIVVLLVLVSGALYAKGLEATRKAGPYAVTIQLQSETPVTGDNAVTILVKDQTGKTVTDAKVSVDYGMPAMPGMPAMKYKAAAELKADTYTGVLNFSMPGSWYVNVKVSKGGKTGTAKLNVDVR